MTTYMRSSAILKKPVVTLDGEDIAQVKDIVFDAPRGGVRCFTLSGRGLLGGPLKRVLPWERTYALGPDAVMVRDERALAEEERAAGEAPSGEEGNVLGSRVMTDDGTDLGRIVDVIIEAGEEPLVAGYEIDSSADPRRRMLLPVLEPVSVSNEMVIVPRANAGFTSGDLRGFAEAAHGLRTRLQQEE